MHEVPLQSIYSALIAEATSRLLAAKRFLAEFTASHEIPEFEAAILQVRKALEAIAYAAIAPDKKQYAEFRTKTESSPDFTKDYHAAKIFTALAKINKNFYPRALVPAQRQADGSYHFGRKESGYLTKRKFEVVYDRLGKHLHAHNPWSGDKNIQNLANDLPAIIEETHGLLDLHARFIRTPELQGVWVCETDRFGNPPRLIVASAQGSYMIADI
jgi:hypothetical protein